MPQNVVTDVYNLTSAKRGATGTEAITGARRLAHRVESIWKEVPGDKMPAAAKITWQRLTIAIETTKDLEHSKHLTTAAEEMVKVTIDDKDGTVTRTYERVQGIGGGESLFPAPEQGGPVGTRELQFIVLEKQDGDGLDTAWSDVRS